MKLLPTVPLQPDDEICKAAFGWNYRAWSTPFLDALKCNSSKYKRVLEIGASNASSVAMALDHDGMQATVGYYESTHKNCIVKKYTDLKSEGLLLGKYEIQRIDAMNVNGNFDAVILKSVLGGLFRNSTSTVAEVNDFIADLKRRTVAEDGLLISIDNGVSFFEPYLQNFGARANDWRFFKPGDLADQQEQFCFGLLSSFSFQTRLGFLGGFIDNSILYRLDRFAAKFYTKNPTVIVSVL